jgi:hypothetical protein
MSTASAALPSNPSADFVGLLCTLHNAPGFLSAGAIRALCVAVADAADEIPTESAAVSVILPAWEAFEETPTAAADVYRMAKPFQGRASAWRAMRADAVADAAAAIVRKF